MELGEIGATEKGGVCRLALTDEEIEARHLLISWARGIGLAVYTDPISNLFFRLEGRDAEAGAFSIGGGADGVRIQNGEDTVSIDPAGGVRIEDGKDTVFVDPAGGVRVQDGAK